MGPSWGSRAGRLLAHAASSSAGLSQPHQLAPSTSATMHSPTPLSFTASKMPTTDARASAWRRLSSVGARRHRRCRMVDEEQVQQRHQPLMVQAGVGVLIAHGETEARSSMCFEDDVCNSALPGWTSRSAPAHPAECGTQADVRLCARCLLCSAQRASQPASSLGGTSVWTRCWAGVERGPWPWWWRSGLGPTWPEGLRRLADHRPSRLR